MTVISDSYAAELVAQLRANTERTDEIGSPVAVDGRDLLILKIWDDLKALEKAMGFLGGGIKGVQRVG